MRRLYEYKKPQIMPKIQEATVYFNNYIISH